MSTTTKPKATPKPKVKAYSLEMTFNGETFTSTTDNLDEELKGMKPDLLHTEVYVTVGKGGEVSERRLSRVMAQRVFLDDVTREVFINNLLLN